jgi:hypothetical protein
MVWLSRACLGDAYVSSVALPMVLVGAGQGLAFAPLTSFGIAGVAPKDAGAASGLVVSAVLVPGTRHSRARLGPTEQPVVRAAA